jgi:hypothetical protein
MKCIRKTNLGRLGRLACAVWSFALCTPPESHIRLNLRLEQWGELVNVGKCRYSGRAIEDFVNRCLRFGPPAVRYGTHPFPDGDEPIGRDLLKSLVQSVWPIHIDVGRGRVPQTEMQAGIAAREKAGLTQDRLRLCRASIMDKHSSSNGASIGLYTFQFHFDPVGLPAEVIAQ